jgi:uncharacterized protein HemX
MGSHKKGNTMTKIAVVLMMALLMFAAIGCCGDESPCCGNRQMYQYQYQQAQSSDMQKNAELQRRLDTTCEKLYSEALKNAEVQHNADLHRIADLQVRVAELQSRLDAISAEKKAEVQPPRNTEPQKKIVIQARRVPSSAAEETADLLDAIGRMQKPKKEP